MKNQLIYVIGKLICNSGIDLNSGVYHQKLHQSNLSDYCGIDFLIQNSSFPLIYL